MSGQVERRPTCARCFLFGDVRSVEATLEAFDACRSPVDPRRRVARLVLAGEPAHVLATAQGVRDVERLRGERFGFALAAARGSADRPALAGCAVLPEVPATNARAALLLMDCDEAMAGTPAGRRALKALVDVRARRPDVPTVAVLRSGAPLARALARSLAAGPLDVVRYDGHNPLLVPAVEGILADADPEVVWLGGRGPRLVGAALGAGDFFLEHAGDAHMLTARDRARIAARAALVRSLTCDAPELASPLEVNSLLSQLGVEQVDGAYDAHAAGVLVYPVEG